jgi:hypothetical protein
MSINMRTKHAKNDTKAIKMHAVSSKNVQNQYGFVLPSLTSLLHVPLGASAKADWPPKRRPKARQKCVFRKTEMRLTSKTGNGEWATGNGKRQPLAGREIF